MKLVSNPATRDAISQCHASHALIIVRQSELIQSLDVVRQRIEQTRALLAQIDAEFTATTANLGASDAPAAYRPVHDREPPGNGAAARPPRTDDY